MKRQARKLLNRVKRIAAAIDNPDITKACGLLQAGAPLPPDLLAFAEAHATDLRLAMAFLGVMVEAAGSPDGLVFRPTKHAGGIRSPEISQAILSLREQLNNVGKPTPPKPAKKQHKKPVASGRWVPPSWSFYATEEWKRLRYQALVASNGRCLCCGSSSKDGAVLRVDHVKPISKYPHLKADPTNLQVVCSDCNWGKGAWDETDWRLPADIRLVARNGQSVKE